jgi:hypothetical protein
MSFNGLESKFGSRQLATINTAGHDDINPPGAMGQSTMSAQSQQLPGRDAHLPRAQIGNLTRENVGDDGERPVMVKKPSNLQLRTKGVPMR